MGISKIEAYIKPTCKDCKGMVNFLKTLNIPFNIIDITTPEGYLLSKDIELYMLPTVFIKDEKNAIVDTAFCVDAVKRILGGINDGR